MLSEQHPISVLKGHSGIFGIGPHFQPTEVLFLMIEAIFSSFDAVQSLDGLSFHC